MGFLSDIGNAVSSSVGAVGDVAEGVVDAVTDTAEDIVDAVVDGVQDGLSWGNSWLCQNAGTAGCWAGNVLLGGLNGLLEGAQDIVGKALSAIKTTGGALGALLRGDFAGFLGKLGALVLDFSPQDAGEEHRRHSCAAERGEKASPAVAERVGLGLSDVLGHDRNSLGLSGKRIGYSIVEVQLCPWQNPPRGWDRRSKLS